MNLTRENYHGYEANESYYSASQVRAFLDCPAAWHATVHRRYARPESEALLVGTYVDLALLSPDEWGAWVDAHAADVFTKAGTMREAFARADAMIAAIRRHPMADDLLRGERQAILTAEIKVTGKGGAEVLAPVRCMLDVLNTATRRVVDLKTTADIFASEWDPMTRRRLHWIAAWDYWLQLAVYRAVVRARHGWTPEVHILAVDKHPRHPTAEWYRLDGTPEGDAELAEAGHRLIGALGMMVQLRDEPVLPRGETWQMPNEIGMDRPLWCGACDWCRMQPGEAAPLVWAGGEWKRGAAV